MDPESAACYKETLCVLVTAAWGENRLEDIANAIKPRLAALRSSQALMWFHWEEEEWLSSFLELDRKRLVEWLVGVPLSLLAVDIQIAVLPELMLIDTSAGFGRGVQGCCLGVRNNHVPELAAYITGSGPLEKLAATCFYVNASRELGDRDANESWQTYWHLYCSSCLVDCEPPTSLRRL